MICEHLRRGEGNRATSANCEMRAIVRERNKVSGTQQKLERGKNLCFASFIHSDRDDAVRNTE